MTTIAAEAAGREFASLLQRVAEGEVIIITDQGKPVARIGPVRKFPMSLEELREWRKGNKLGPDMTLERLIEEGRQR